MTALLAHASALLLACSGVPPHLEPIDEDEAPIDDWPVSAPADLSVELAVSRALGEASPPGDATALADDDEPLLPGDVAGVWAFEGHVAGLRYLEVVLGDADPEDELPLVVLLHGRGDRPRIPGGPYLGLPVPVRVFVPRAPERLGDGFSWLATYARSGSPELFAESLAATASRVADAIRLFTRIRPTRGVPIVTGFSQGGHLAWALAARHPDVVGYAIPCAGWVPASIVPAARRDGVVYPRVRSLHGVEDHPVPVELGRESAGALRALGLDVQLVEAAGAGHEMTPEMDARFHGWLAEAVEAQRASPAATAPPGSDQ